MKKDRERLKSLASVRWIFSYIKPYRGWFIFNIIASGAIIAANLAKAYFIQGLINNALDGDMTKVASVVVMFVLVVCCGAIFSYLSRLSMGKYSLLAIKDLRHHLAAHLTKVKTKKLGEIQSGDLASRLNNDTEMIHSFIKSQLPDFIVQVILGVGACIYIFVISWKLLAVSILFIPFGMFAAYYLNSNAGKYYPESYKYLGEASGEVEQSILGIDIIKAFSLKGLFSQRLRGRYRKVYQAELTAQKYVSILQPVCYAIANIPEYVAIIFGSHMAFRGEIRIGTLIGVLELYEYIIVPAVMFPFIMNRIQRSIAAIDRIEEVIKLPQERSTGKVLVEASDGKALTIHDLSFSYDGSDPVLQDINLELPLGQMTALVGASGSGKSTLANLISGLHEYDSGSIKLFGSDLHDLSLKSIRDHIAVVSQDTYLFPGTIAENISYGRASNAADVSRDEVIKAAQAARAHEFIKQLPGGYDTVVGEGGTSLSRGQRQRISIARAFLKDAPILILDEPTASLDNYSEALIQQSIEHLSQGVAVLVIAHRLSTIVKADQILVLDKGRIVERGTHPQLVGKKGHYYRLYNTQFSA